MNIFSRRKRLLNRTSTRTNSGPTAFGRGGRIRGAFRRNRTNLTVIGQASGRGQFRKIFRRGRAGAAAMPKMSSRRQFHRALRRHPAWPAVMEQAAARARAQEGIRRERSGITAMGQASNRTRLRRIFLRNRTGLRRFALPVVSSVKDLLPDTAAAWRRSKVRRSIRRNRVLLVTLLAVGGLVALLTGISVAQGEWNNQLVGAGQPPRPRFGAATTFITAPGKEEVLLFGGFASTGVPVPPPNTVPPGTVPETIPVPQNPAEGPAENLGAPDTIPVPENSAPEILGVPKTVPVPWNPVREVPVPGSPVREVPLGIVTDGETWTFRSKWIRRDPITSPSARGFAAMAYDRARKNTVLFGGAPYKSNAVSGETWIWDHNERDWTLQHPPEPVPDPRQNAVMVYDPHRRVVMMYGGRGDDGKPMGDTWTWDGSRWTIMPRDGAPSPRHSAAIAYDECRGEAVMFGGVGDPVNNFASHPGETWIWNGARWRTPEKPELVTGVGAPRLSPPRRIGASMGYSHRSGRVLLYGGLYTTDAGQATAAIDHDVWRWNGDDPPGAGDGQLHAGWEKLNVEATTVATIPCSAVILCGIGTANWIVPAPPPRAYASFTDLGADYHYFGGRGGGFSLFGGTPGEEVRTGLPLDSTLRNVPQAAHGDHYIFTEAQDSLLGWLYGDTSTDNPVGFGTSTPLTRRCVNPVPLPPEDEVGIDLAAEARNKLTAREGVREIGQLPVLLGTDWPEVKRNALLYNPQRPNPNYTPPPDCPNRTTINQGATSGNTEDGRNTYLITDQKRNRVYQFFVCDRDRGLNEQSLTRPVVSNLLIEAYHGTTLKPVGKVILRNVLAPQNSGFRTSLVHEADRGRFFFRSSYYNGSTEVKELLDIRQDAIEKGVDPIAGRSNYAGTPIEGNDLEFFKHPKTGRPKMFFAIPGGGATAGPPPSQGTPPKLAQWDIEGSREDWRVELTGCSGLGRTIAMRSGDRVYTNCFSSNRFAVARIPIIEDSTVPAGERPGTSDPPYPGPSGGEVIGNDPQAERMVLLQGDGGGKRVWVFDGKVSRWVGRVGITSNSILTPLTSFDRDTARLYVQMPDNAVSSAGQPLYPEQGGLMIVDTGLTPVPQPLKFPQFASFPALGDTIASLPPGPGVPRRVFIRRAVGKMKKYPDGETVKMPNEMFYRVLADEVPVPEKTDISQLDALTVPVAETPGKTEASFDAEGSGYGIRLRSVGGIWSTLRPFAQAHAGNGEFAESFFLGFVRPYIPGCVFPDRELIAGFVPQARLSDQDAGARSLGLEVDSNSKTDLRGPFSRCNPTANASNFPPSAKPVFDTLWPLWQLVQLQGNNAVGSGAVETGKDADGNTDNFCSSVPRPECGDTPLGALELGKDEDGNPTVGFTAPTSVTWDRHFKEVECVGDSLATNTATVGNVYGSAKCVQRQGLVEATARGSASGVGPLGEEASSRGFSVGEGNSTVTVAREQARGVVVTSTAVAKGIQLPNLTIGYIKTEAVAWSNGRPGVSRATFTRTICNVDRNPPIPINPPDITKDDRAPSTGCLTENQQKALVKNWNDRWGINSKMILPAYDPELFAGSPGGYIAGVIKPVADEVEDQLFAKDSQREVPGLVIEFYKDSPTEGLGRQVLMLAATRAVAGLGVQCNSELVYSSVTNKCVDLTFEDDLVTEEFEEEEEFTEDEAELDSADGFWEPVEESLPEPLALGKRLGRFIQNLPILRQLPIREIGEALLAFPVWLLLGLPLLLASRRFALNQAHQRGD